MNLDETLLQVKTIDNIRVTAVKVDGTGKRVAPGANRVHRLQNAVGTRHPERLAAQVVKDPYVFEFLGDLAADISERQLERKLIHHIRDFLLELGKGFAFVGSQYHLEVDEQDFYLDLLFYHLHLRCYVVIDLKVEAFRPEFAGKMAFYVNAVDDLVRDAGRDQPTIGIVLCKERSRVIVEYTLRDTSRPIGVSTYRLLPEPMRDELPSPEALEAELEDAVETEQAGDENGGSRKEGAG